MNLWVIFLTGLTVGGLTCLAVQGGLLASVVADRKLTLLPTSAFLIAKLITYTVLGFILGAFGGAINISEDTQTYMQLAAGLYMVAIALNLLNVHPIFRYAIIQPPKFLTRLVHNQSKSKDVFAPALLGAMTVFIPCGTTLAMEVLAISSASAVNGALIMAAFILGTIPLFFGVGVITSFLGEAFKSKFLKLAAVLIIYLGLSSINGSLVVMGSPITMQSIIEAFTVNSDSINNTTVNHNPEIFITSSGYSPNYIRVAKGAPVTIKLTSQNAYSCAAAFRIPSLGIAKNLKINDTQTITFTPTQTGRIPFSCSMGMYSGIIEVI